MKLVNDFNSFTASRNLEPVLFMAFLCPCEMGCESVKDLQHTLSQFCGCKRPRWTCRETRLLNAVCTELSGPSQTDLWRLGLVLSSCEKALFCLSEYSDCLSIVLEWRAAANELL